MQEFHYHYQLTNHLEMVYMSSIYSETLGQRLGFHLHVIRMGFEAHWTLLGLIKLLVIRLQI